MHEPHWGQGDVLHVAAVIRSVSEKGSMTALPLLHRVNVKNPTITPKPMHAGMTSDLRFTLGFV